MVGATLLTQIVTLASGVHSIFPNTQTPFSDICPLLRDTCQEIASSISAASDVYDQTSPKYLKDIKHWTSWSTQFAACSFEPGTPEDVGIALRIIARTRMPFAVKGGGHATNPGFSSTEGIQIAMSRFSEVTYDPVTQTVIVGAGLTWDEVYEALEPYGVNVAGGRIAGVGVAGFTLGGGYSWHTNQYGLTIDTVQAFELVTPNGTVVDVTEILSPDLFFALKGGLNNYGIVTRFTFRAFPQTQVWGGLITYSPDVRDQVMLATANFSANSTDPKAGIIMVYQHLFGQVSVLVDVFYDAPTAPEGVFDEFLAIASVERDISTRSFPSFVRSLLDTTASPKRCVFNSISVATHPVSFIQSAVNEADYWRQKLPDDVASISYDIQPFLPSLFTHNTTPTAYPPSRAQGLFPLNIHFAWDQPEHDDTVSNVARKTAQTLYSFFIEDGQSDVPSVVYPNYAIFGTPVANLYGENLPRLRAIKAVVDPENVMGLAGGFKI
ncbi:FAD-binding domain-containing protein [Chiua virens]|nr:FAD-binding domain-containing protein [Chiua virens]